ncbi:non-specific lipid transfer protein GPI-anchored 14-like [Impatiens glandulifera]|uniref:non-specific lipid transfer protein GPI-anchored 14-like n=1 Tax=Impatiens glandulifera TaxID=253017 RepID=UPI001FB17159|nr:non-specific lipid transfer protein GPI-anchored 14-like [Impatiens glandulifera]
MQGLGFVVVVMMMMMMMMNGGVVIVVVSAGNISEEKNECADQLIGLAPCLGYVGGSGNRPTVDCCTGLKQVVQKSKRCICILVKDRDEPSLGFKINVTRALTLPNVCHAPANVSDCTALLNLAPNSPEAKVFDDFFEHGQNNNTTTTTKPGKATSTPASSNTRNRPDSHHLLLVATLAITLALLIYCFPI